MGASESTGRSNRAQREEEERQQETGRGSTGAAAAIAMAAAGAAVTAWGVSRMLSDNSYAHENNEAMSIQQAPVVTNSHGEHGSYNGVYTRVLYQPPFQGHYKMNTDGACRPSRGARTDPTEQVMRGPSGYGGILRDQHGKWVRGFRGYIGVSDCLTAEFHGILKGLLLLDRLCLHESILESDSAAAIEWINHDERLYRRRTQVIKDCWDIILECKRLIKNGRITFRCCPRNANKCADKLANMGIDRGQEPYVEIIDLPVEIKDIVDHESSML